MPKHSRKRKREEEDSDKYFRKKIRKLEKKLRRRKKRSHSSSSSSSNSSEGLSSQQDRNVGQGQEDSKSMDHYDLTYYNSVEDDISATPPGLRSPDSDLINTNSAASNQCSATLGQTNKNQPAADIAPHTTPVQPSNQCTEPVEPELDKDILELLGESPSKEKKYGPKLKSELATRWSHILTNGLTKEDRKQLSEKYLIPENCKVIDAPILNPETKAALSDTLVKKDKAIENKQKRSAAVISSLGEAITRLFDLGIKDASVIKPLLDAGRLACDLQHTESLIRRSFICSTLKKEVKDQLYNTDIDKFLFSEKLADALKTAKAIQKSGSDMKIPAPSARKSTMTSRPLNSRPPPPTGRSSGVSRKQEPATGTNRRQLAAPAKTSVLAPPPKPQQRSQAHTQQRRR